MDSSFSFGMRRKKSLTFHYSIKIAPSQEDRSGRADKSARFSVVASIDKSRKVWYNKRGNININIYQLLRSLSTSSLDAAFQLPIVAAAIQLPSCFQLLKT